MPRTRHFLPPAQASLPSSRLSPGTVSSLPREVQPRSSLQGMAPESTGGPHPTGVVRSTLLAASSRSQAGERPRDLDCGLRVYTLVP